MAVKSVKSEITGKVWKVEVKPGDRVEFEDVLILIESMKMEIPVLAPVAGIVTAILVAAEDDVSEGQEVARIDG